jgi:hypothetical protein
MVPSVFSRGQAIAIGLTSTGLRDAAMLTLGRTDPLGLTDLPDPIDPTDPIDLIDLIDLIDPPDPPDPSDLAYLYQYGVFCAQTLFG